MWTFLFWAGKRRNCHCSVLGMLIVCSSGCLGWRCSSHVDGPVMEMNADTGQWGTRWVTGHLLSTHGDVLCKLTTEITWTFFLLTLSNVRYSVVSLVFRSLKVEIAFYSCCKQFVNRSTSRNRSY